MPTTCSQSTGTPSLRVCGVLLGMWAHGYVREWLVLRWWLWRGVVGGVMCVSGHLVVQEQARGAAAWVQVCAHLGDREWVCGVGNVLAR